MARYVRVEERDWQRQIKEANDCRLALAAFMAAYGNCDIPGAILTLAHKPEQQPGMTMVDACETAMFRAFMRGVKALGLQFRDPPIVPQSKGEVAP